MSLCVSLSNKLVSEYTEVRSVLVYYVDEE